MFTLLIAKIYELFTAYVILLRNMKVARESMQQTVEKTSVFQKNLERGIAAGIITLSEDLSKITYSCARNFTTLFKNPEEKVRASYFAELVLDYQYPKERMDFEVLVPRRTPEDRADIVIY